MRNFIRCSKSVIYLSETERYRQDDRDNTHNLLKLSSSGHQFKQGSKSKAMLYTECRCFPSIWWSGFILGECCLSGRFVDNQMKLKWYNTASFKEALFNFSSLGSFKQIWTRRAEDHEAFKAGMQLFVPHWDGEGPWNGKDASTGTSPSDWKLFMDSCWKCKRTQWTIDLLIWWLHFFPPTQHLTITVPVIHLFSYMKR